MTSLRKSIKKELQTQIISTLSEWNVKKILGVPQGNLHNQEKKSIIPSTHCESAFDLVLIYIFLTSGSSCLKPLYWFMHHLIQQTFFLIQHHAKIIICETYSMTFQSNSSNLENPDSRVLENLMTLLKLFRKEAARCIAVFTYVHAWVNKVIKRSLGSLLNLTEKLCWKPWQLHQSYWSCFPICTKAFGF